MRKTQKKQGNNMETLLRFNFRYAMTTLSEISQIHVRLNRLRNAGAKLQNPVCGYDMITVSNEQAGTS